MDTEVPPPVPATWLLPGSGRGAARCWRATGRWARGRPGRPGRDRRRHRHRVRRRERPAGAGGRGRPRSASWPGTGASTSAPRPRSMPAEPARPQPFVWLPPRHLLATRSPYGRKTRAGIGW